jgi:hypothetical protein
MTWTTTPPTIPGWYWFRCGTPETRSAHERDLRYVSAWQIAHGMPKGDWAGPVRDEPIHEPEEAHP